jgi:hypothetical protein
MTSESLLLSCQNCGISEQGLMTQKTAIYIERKCYKYKTAVVIYSAHEFRELWRVG